jgi:hypothetical protein
MAEEVGRRRIYMGEDIALSLEREVEKREPLLAADSLLRRHGRRGGGWEAKRSATKREMR